MVNIIHPEDSLRTVIDCFQTTKLSFALVLTEASLLGVLTQGDIIRAIRKKIELNVKANKIMTVDFVTTSESDFDERLKVHRHYKFPYIPVVRDGQLIGVSSIYSEEIMTING
jgi:CBS domain-containing protein